MASKKNKILEERKKHQVFLEREADHYRGHKRMRNIEEQKHEPIEEK